MARANSPVGLLHGGRADRHATHRGTRGQAAPSGGVNVFAFTSANRCAPRADRGQMTRRFRHHRGQTLFGFLCWGGSGDVNRLSPHH